MSEARDKYSRRYQRVQTLCPCAHHDYFASVLPYLPHLTLAERMGRGYAWPEQITYWDAYDGTAIRVIEGGDEEMNTLDVEPSGEAFVSGGDDGLVKVRCIVQ